MDKQQIAECFARARQTYDREARVQHQVAERMLGFLLHTLTKGQTCLRIAEMGCGTGIYSRLLFDALHPQQLWLNDLCPEMQDSLDDLLSQPTVSFTPGDAESMALPPRNHVITSCSTFQWFSDLLAFFQHCHRALQPEGLLAFSTFGPENLHEIRILTGNGLHYFTLPEIRAMLSPDFHVIHASEEVAILTFPTPTEVLRHLKQTGVTGTEKRIWTRTRLQQFSETYIRLFSTEEGPVSLTYHPMYVIAEKR